MPAPSVLAMIDSLPTPPVVYRQLERILASETFANARKSALLLEFLVRGTLSGTVPEEKDLAIDLFDEKPDWQPVHGSKVRVSLTRLRLRLADYYKKEGRNELVIIRIAEGRDAVFKYNYESPFIASPPSSLSLDFSTTLENYFLDPYTGSIRCVITGELADWHHLDGDPCNNAIGNLVPLCERLRSHLSGLEHGAQTTHLPELDPGHLADFLAPHYFTDWQIARAYGCAHLAFHMGQPPYGNETSDLRLLRLCDTLSYTRHRFNESIVAYVIRHSLLPLLMRVESLDPRTMCRLALQLSGLVDESGYFGTAADALALAESLISKFEPLVYPPGSLNRFVLFRRQAQLLMEKNPAGKPFVDVMKQAEEQICGDANRPFTLEIVQTARRFRQGTTPGTRQAYDALAPIVASSADEMFGVSRFLKPALITPANLAQVFIFAGIAACRLRPDRWEDFAREMIIKGKNLCRHSGFSLIPEFWEVISQETFEANPKAQRVLQLWDPYVRPRLRESTRVDIESALKYLKRMVVVEKKESLPGWWENRPSEG